MELFGMGKKKIDNINNAQQAETTQNTSSPVTGSSPITDGQQSTTSTVKKEKKKVRLTEKQVYLSVAGVTAAAVILATAVFIVPLSKKIKSNTAKEESLSLEYDSLSAEADSYDVNLKKFNEVNNKFIAQKDKLFDIMDSDTVDKTITPIIKEIGFKVQSVNISDLTGFFIDSNGTITPQTMKYYEALQYSEESTEDPTEAATEETTEASTKDGVTYGEAQSEINGNAQASTEPKLTNTGEYYYTLNYELTGSYKNISDLVKAITKDVSLSISNLTFQSNTENTTDKEGNIEAIGGIEGTYTVNVTIDVYMYEDPSTGVKNIKEIFEEGSSEDASDVSESTEK